MAEVRNVRKARVGKVVSNKMDKTVVVQIDRKVPHELYSKPMVTSKRFKAHDENHECLVGDIVKIVETRPLSKDKRWRVVEIIERQK